MVRLVGAAPTAPTWKEGTLANVSESRILVENIGSAPMTAPCKGAVLLLALIPLGTPPEIRTQTVLVLSQFPLPVGIEVPGTRNKL